MNNEVLCIGCHRFDVIDNSSSLEILCSISDKEKDFIDNWASSAINPLTGQSMIGKPCDSSLFPETYFKRLPMSGMYKAYKAETISHVYFGVWPIRYASNEVVFVYDEMRRK